jgi:hypothetical protein
VCGSIRYTAISRNDELAVKYFGSDTTREFQLDSTYLLDFTPLAPSHVIGTLDVPVRVRISTTLAKGVICSSWPSGLRRDEQEGGFMIGGTGDSVRDTNSWGGWCGPLRGELIWRNHVLAKLALVGAKLRVRISSWLFISLFRTARIHYT